MSCCLGESSFSDDHSHKDGLQQHTTVLCPGLSPCSYLCERSYEGSNGMNPVNFISVNPKGFLVLLFFPIYFFLGIP